MLKFLLGLVLLVITFTYIIPGVILLLVLVGQLFVLGFVIFFVIGLFGLIFNAIFK